MFDTAKQPQIVRVPTPENHAPARQLAHDRAMTCAEEYARLVRYGGDSARADGIEATIDRLVGQWMGDRFMWPARIAETAGVERERRRS